MGSATGTRLHGAVLLAGALLAGCSPPESPETIGQEQASADGDVFGGPAPGAQVRAAAEHAIGILVAEGQIPLQGAKQVPGPGDPDGAGSAAVVIVEERNEVCVEITVRGLDQPTAAHIHAGRVGAAGDVVLAVPAPTSGDGSVDACVSAAPDVIARLQADPGAFYVDVHTAAAPEGALRGQFGSAL